MTLARTEQERGEALTRHAIAEGAAERAEAEAGRLKGAPAEARRQRKRALR